VEIGGVRGGRERLLEKELELFNGTIIRNQNGGGFPGYRPDLDFSPTAPCHSFFVQPNKGFKLFSKHTNKFGGDLVDYNLSRRGKRIVSGEYPVLHITWEN
jgi:hypothetical protein